MRDDGNDHALIARLWRDAGGADAARPPLALSGLQDVLPSAFDQLVTSAGLTARAESIRKSPSRTFEKRSIVKASLLAGGFGKIPVTSARTATVSVLRSAGRVDTGLFPQPAAGTTAAKRKGSAR